MRYSLTPDAGFVLRDDGVTLPIHDESNDDCRAFLAWLAAGNAPDPAPAVPVPPRQQLGGVFLGAVVDLGWWGWFDQGAASQAAAAPSGAGKPLDARYWASIGKADIVLATDAKLTRVARAAEAARVAASGGPAPSAAVITLAAAMDRGDAMVAAGT